MSVQTLYPSASTTAKAANEVTRRAQDAFVRAADAWTDNLPKVADGVSLPAAPQILTEVPTAVVEQWFDFTDRVNKVNREYFINLTGVANAWSTAVRDHLEGLGEAVRDQSQHVTEAMSETAKQQVAYAVEAEQEVADRALEAEREQTRAFSNAERQRVRAANKAAHEKYEGMTKAELVEELASRDLPKTGNVGELVERLVEADTE